MSKIPVIILRIIAILSAIFGIILCIFALPSFGTSIAKNFPQYAIFQYPALIGLYAAASCFFYALYQFWLLLNHITRHGKLQVKNLKAIKVSGIAFGILYAIFFMPIIYLAADAGDAPGMILFGLFVGSFSWGAASVAAILEKISQSSHQR